MPAEHVIDSALESFISSFNHIFSKPQQAHFRAYILGLILYISTAWMSRIHEHVGHTKSYRTFVNFLSDSPWSTREVEINWHLYLNHHQRRVLKALKRRAKGKDVPVYLAIDDTTNPKRGKKMAWVGNHYSHSHKTVINGHCLVSAYLVIGNLTIPVAFSLYKKKSDCQKEGVPFASKIEIASQIVENFKPLPGTKVYVLADRWYGANKFFKLVAKKKGFEIIAAIKSNRNLYYDQTKKQAREYAKDLSDNEFDTETIERRLYRLHSREVRLSSGTKGKVVVSRLQVGKKDVTFFIFSSDKSLSAKQIVESYRIRWDIETFYKNAKQLLGLCDYQVVCEQAIMRHFLFVFLAASFLEVQRQLLHEQLLLHDPNADKPTLGDVKRLYEKTARRIFIKSVFDYVTQGLTLQNIYQRLAP